MAASGPGTRRHRLAAAPRGVGRAGATVRPAGARGAGRAGREGRRRRRAGGPDPMSVDLEPLFAPRRVAVLGVSRSPEKLGYRLLQNLLEAGFPGEVVPVNPSGEAILGVKSVARVADLPEGLDLALVSLPAAAVAGAVAELGRLGCRA